MAGSPRRIYRAYSDAQVIALFNSLVDAQINGRFTSLSGQGHSSQSEFANMDDQLFEATEEMKARGLNGLTPTPTTIYQVFNNCLPPGTIAG